MVALTRVLHEACLSEDLACSAPVDSGRSSTGSAVSRNGQRAHLLLDGRRRDPGMIDNRETSGSCTNMNASSGSPSNPREDFLVGLDRQRGDEAGQVLPP